MVLICFFLTISDGEHLLRSCWSLLHLLGKMSVQVLCPIFNWVVYIFWFPSTNFSKPIISFLKNFHLKAVMPAPSFLRDCGGASGREARAACSLTGTHEVLLLAGAGHSSAPTAEQWSRPALCPDAARGASVTPMDPNSKVASSLPNSPPPRPLPPQRCPWTGCWHMPPLCRGRGEDGGREG